ncbi:unnamed protein product, partial [marine sediment metagenome]
MAGMLLSDAATPNIAIPSVYLMQPQVMFLPTVESR